MEKENFFLWQDVPQLSPHCSISIKTISLAMLNTGNADLDVKFFFPILFSSEELWLQQMHWGCHVGISDQQHPGKQEVFAHLQVGFGNQRTHLLVPGIPIAPSYLSQYVSYNIPCVVNTTHTSFLFVIASQNLVASGMIEIKLNPSYNVCSMKKEPINFSCTVTPFSSFDCSIIFY